jgi:hypothetical protein
MTRKKQTNVQVGTIQKEDNMTRKEQTNVQVGTIQKEENMTRKEQTNVQVGTRLDFTNGLDELERQMGTFSFQQRLHILRLFAKFKRYYLNKYQVLCGAPEIIVSYIFDGRRYNFVVSGPKGENAKVVLDTRDVDDSLALAIYHATRWLIKYIQDEAAYNTYYEAKSNGYLIRSESAKKVR